MLMRFQASLALFALLAIPVIAVSGCGRDQPTAPTPHTLSGPVELTGYLVASGGQFAGTKVVTDADGIVVELLYANQVVATTKTVDGVYHFPNLNAGYYVARTRVHGVVGDTTEALTIANQDVTVRDVLRVRSHGDLVPVPNPFNPGLTNAIYFDLADSQVVDFEIRDLSGNVVRTLSQGTGFRAGFNHVNWNTLDDQGVAATDPIYWAIFTSGSDMRAHLLFRKPPPS
jgi:hypothetical protein